ncbi:unnamed protein product [Blepharisma stoltei]|uniref:Sm domain-containing protein n=1 Tax=Blepharisma stoltei TaxID=1481888 RepID=A0AAU9K8A9_9CILI|nr:unnamed protein product [Blepharisma stoltei]
MVSTLDQFVEREIYVISTDGRQYQGILKGFDQAVNLIVSQCKLISWNQDCPRDEIDCQIMIIRGDTVVLLGLKDPAMELPDIADPIPQIIHT